MLHSLEVLQLSLGELETFVREAALENEALQVDERPEPGGEGPRGMSPGAREASDRHEAWLESQPESGPDLAAALEEQLALVDVDPGLLPWVRLAIGAVDARGYLSISDEALLELAREEGLAGDAGTLGRAIAVLQGLEPRGIGGRDAVEALLLQLDPAAEDYGLLCHLLEDFLEDVARNKLPAVARGLGVDLGRLDELLQRLRELDPAPGSALSGSSSPGLRPDVVVEPVTPSGGAPLDAARGFEIRVVRSGLPPLALDPEVRRLARDPRQPEGVRRHLRGQVDRARWLLEAVEQREETLLRVAGWALERQRAFLEKGPGHLVPLTMTEAAEALGVHVSTVSRAVAGKTAETPWGLQPLRGLFQTPAGDGAGAGRDGVGAALRRIVDAEDPEHPLSDDEIVRRLEEAGHRVARRTVAKYRRDLGIPSSYRRRRYSA
jgi:RNA polymerase sigma-54 factor